MHHGLFHSQIRWRKGDEDLAASDRVLTERKFDQVSLCVKNCDMSDTGTYSVTLVNLMGEASAQIKAQVKGKGTKDRAVK